MQIKIDSEFKSLIPPLKADERALLEESIISEGCREPLVVWNGVLIDGHNRYEICQKKRIEFKTCEHNFSDRDDAKLWILKNQMGRRNLPDITRGILALKYKSIIAAKAKENSLHGVSLRAVVTHDSPP